MTKPDRVYCCLLWSSDEKNDCSTGNSDSKSLNNSTSSRRFSSFVYMPAVFSVRAIGQLYECGDFTSLQSAESLASQTIFQHVPGNLAKSLRALSHGLLASSQNKFKPALCFPHMRRYQYHVRCTHRYAYKRQRRNPWTKSHTPVVQGHISIADESTWLVFAHLFPHASSSLQCTAYP